jgi:DNA-binding IclR family transcriptional regulator
VSATQIRHAYQGVGLDLYSGRYIMGSKVINLAGVHMDRLALKDILSIAVAQRENEINESEHLVDLGDKQSVCTAELCGVVWKPLPAKSDRKDEIE